MSQGSNWTEVPTHPLHFTDIGGAETSGLVIHTALGDGTPVCLREIRPSDAARMRQGIKDLSDQSRYLRFFSAFKDPLPHLVEQLSAVDGHNHIGWGAIKTDGTHQAIGAAHAIRIDKQSPVAEVAIALLDDYQGQGLGRMLVAAILLACRNARIEHLEMHMIAENQRAARLFEKFGAVRRKGVEPVTTHCLSVSTGIKRLEAHAASPELTAIINALDLCRAPAT